MSLKTTDKKEIEVLIRNEIKHFMKSNQITDLITKEIKKELKEKVYDEKMVDISTKVVVELFKTLWIRKSFWEGALKNVK